MPAIVRPVHPSAPTQFTAPLSVATTAAVAMGAAATFATTTSKPGVASPARGVQVGSRPSLDALEPHWAAAIDAATD